MADKLLFEADAAPAFDARADGESLTGVAVSVHRDLPEVSDVWRAFQQGADCTAFQTFEWHEAWHRHIGAPAGVTPAIVVGRVRGRVAFILPFALEATRFARRLVWHASDLCDYNAPLLAPDFAEMVGDFPSVFSSILRQIGEETPFDAVLLSKMPDTVGRQKNPFLAMPTSLNPSGAYRATLGTDWDKYYAEKRPSLKRKRDRNKRKRLADFGPVSFTTPVDDRDRAANLDVLLEQKGKAFASMGVNNFLARPEVRAFFADLTLSPATRDMIHLSHLDVGSQMMATNLGLVFGGRYYHVLASYDAGPASKFGPGAVHLLELIAYAIRNRLEVFDFTIGDERYKREWSDIEVALHDYRAAVTLRGYLLGLPGLAVSEAKRLIKQNRVLWPIALKVRAALAGRKQPAEQAPVDED
ncbi:MAG TPA: GNAT family N-acetyltransferase [Bauldia sp.]|nr:GNAT family N-acetyltransferase [Bauldia sp.]